jgi:AI-2 transport protein TqsA
MNGDSIQPGADGDRTQRICLIILTVIVIGFALYFMRPVLLPLLFALFLYLCLTPLIDFQVNRIKLPYSVSLATTVLIGTLAVLLIIAIGAS